MSRAIGAGELSMDSPVLAHHQKATDGMGKLARGLANHFQVPPDFDDWLFLTQLNQARAITLGVEHLRSIRDVCSGTIVWQLNDCWPVISWSAVDGDGRRKPMWYALRRAYADRLLTIQPAEFQLRATLINETATPWSTEVHARRLRLDGEPLAEWRSVVEVDARGMTVVDLPGSSGVPQHPTEEILVLDGGDQRTTWTWLPDRDLRYPDARLEGVVEAVPGGYRVTLTAASLLRDVCLFPDRLHPDAVVDEMLVTLLPGESATFHVSGAVLADPDALLRAPVLRCVNDRRRS
jgi:beta-mannosidase